MKKHYIRLTAVIASLIFTAFVLSMGLFTYASASKIMNQKWALADNNARIASTDYNENISDDEAIKYIYEKFYVQSVFLDDEEMGFYEVIDLDENTKIESGNFFQVYYYSDDGTDRIEGKRFIPVGDDIRGNRRLIFDPDINAICDDNFIFNGTISFYDYETKKNVKYTIGDNKLAAADNTVHTSEVYAGKSLTADYCSFTKTKYEAELNREAKEKLEDIKAKLEKGYAVKVIADDGNPIYYSNGNADGDYLDKQIKNGEYVVFRQKSLGTSYYIRSSYFNSPKENSYVICLFHPIELAFRTHIFVYILSLIAFIILEAVAVFSMRKLYGNRMSYELMRQDLTRSIAHDLKTPLAVTKAYTENWEYIDEEDRHEYAEKLNMEVDNMAAMIDNMLNMSKLDSEKDLKLEEVELYAVTSAIYERMKPIIAERGLNVKLITDVIGGEYYVNADPKMIKIAIGNFITNAVKYAESKVEIKLLGKDKKVTFMVSNDGQGINKKDIKRIWEPFYKTDKSRTDRMGSSGMGLAINSSILRLHKAKFKCISDKNETSFWFELKRVK